jgi:hypothetical protein
MYYSLSTNGLTDRMKSQRLHDRLSLGYLTFFGVRYEEANRREVDIRLYLPTSQIPPTSQLLPT